MPSLNVLDRDVVVPEGVTAKALNAAYRRYVKRIVVISVCAAVLTCIFGVPAYTHYVAAASNSAVVVLAFMALVAVVFVPTIHILANRAAWYRQPPKHRKRSRAYRRYRLYMLRKMRSDRR